MVRQITVSKKYRRNKFTSVNTPKLILTGDWLTVAGFGIGDKIKVLVANDQLIITK